MGIVLCLLAMTTREIAAADWTRPGADAGMTKYTPDTLPAVIPQLAYKKRFYATWNGYNGNYMYGSNLVIHKGQAVLFSNDANDGAYVATKFDWNTKETLVKFPQPFVNQYGPLDDAEREINSHHFTNPLIWHSDGRIYCRRGGDNNAIYVLDPEGGTWTPITQVRPPGNVYFGGDSNAFIQTYGDQLIYHFGDTRTYGPYAAYDISAAAFQNGTLGAYQTSINPILFDSSQSGYAAGDIPKVAGQISVTASLLNFNQVYLETTNVVTGAPLWQKTLASDSGGLLGFNTSVSDYWRFLATEDGQFVFFTRPGGVCTLQVLDLATGNPKWNYPMKDGGDRPLLAYHNGALYVIGRSEQIKFDIHTGAVIWKANGSFPNDAGYLHKNYEYGTNLTNDPVYRPVVLTDDSVWFVDGSYSHLGVLVGLKTSDGSVIKTIDLAALVNSGTESLELVNDLVAADGKLGVLLDITDSSDPHTPQNRYQDLYVYNFPTSPGIFTACDIDQNGSANVSDVQLAIIQATGTSACVSFGQAGSADINQDGKCTVVDVQRVVNAALGGQCVSP